jgi:MFS family permease
MFPASQRGLAMTLFAAAPFLGPVIGPIGESLLALSIDDLRTILTHRSWRLRRPIHRMALDRRRHGHLYWRPLVDMRTSRA